MSLDPVSNAVGKSVIGAAVRPVVDFVRRQFSRRGAEFSDLNDLVGIDDELSEAFNVLSHDGSTAMAFLSNGLKALLSQRPDVFSDRNARHFIADERIISLGKSATRKLFRYENIEAEQSAARAIYATMFEDEEPAFGERIFDDGVAFAVKSIAVYLGPQDRMLIEAFNGLRSDALDHFKEITARLDRIDQGYGGWDDTLQLGTKVRGVPRTTRNMLPRPSLTNHIARSLLTLSNGTPKSIVLVGEGGAGKTTAAAMIGRRSDVLEAFPDGIFWLSLGQTPDIIACQATWLNYVTDRPLIFPSTMATTAFLSAYFEQRQALLILDDVWNQSDLSPFQVAGPKCRTLVTTREHKLGDSGTIIKLGSLSPVEAIDLIRMRALCDLPDDDSLRALARGLDHSPLALELAAYQLGAGSSPAELMSALENETELLAALDKPGHMHESDPEIARNQSLDACINLSVKRLEPDLAHCFAQLSIVRPGTNFSLLTASRVVGRSELGVGRVLRRLWATSLLERDDSGTALNQYKMHAVFRAKAANMLATTADGDLDPAAQAVAINAYLRRCNCRYPHDWHLIDDDEHTIRNLTYYLIKSDDVPSILSILGSPESGGNRSPNYWHRARTLRTEEELFGIEIGQIHDHFAAKKGRDIETLTGLTQSHVARASLADMNRDIDLPLCLALLKAELWTEGQVASQARRRFSPVDMMRAARHLSEPLRSETLVYAAMLAEGSRPDAGLAAELVRVAEVFELPTRQKVIDASRRLISASLDTAPEFSRSDGLHVSKLRFLRAALFLRHRLGDAALPEGQGWIIRFLDQLDGMRPLVVKGEMPFEDRERDTFNETVWVAETLLFLSKGREEKIAQRALALASRLLEDELADFPGYSALRCKLRLFLNADPDGIRNAAQRALTTSDDRYATASEKALWQDEHLGALAEQLASLFATDPVFVGEIVRDPYPNRQAMAFLEASLSLDSACRENVVAQIGTAYGGMVDRITRHGSIVPRGTQAFRLTEKHYQLVAMLLRSGLGNKSITIETVLENLARVSGSFDRLRLLEAVLPCLGRLDLLSVEKLGALFTSVDSASVAWLAVGTRVPDTDRDAVLKRALCLLAEIDDPTMGLRALSRYIGGYSGSHATQLGRSAATLAAGIGDVDAMRGAFTRASVAMEAGERRTRVRAPMWDWSDTMPSHAEIDQIPPAKSLTIPGFWNWDNPLSNTQFLNFVATQLSIVADDVTRAGCCRAIADLAQEFALRGMPIHANVLAQAIFEGAAMYP